MKLVYFLLIMLTVTGVACAQLAPDRERFDIELHPGEVEEKTITLTNVGDKPIFEIKSSPVGGQAKDMVMLDIPGFDYIDPGEDVEMSILFVLPPETAPGSYSGVVYLFDDTPMSLPIHIEFQLQVTKQESYGVSLTVNDAASAKSSTRPDEPAEFDLLVKNTGRFRDVISVDASYVPPGWTIYLLEGDNPIELPHELPVPPGNVHKMTLQISGLPGETGEVMMTARSLGDRLRNSTASAIVDFGLALRGYEVKMDIPEKMVVNQTYTGTFSIFLGRDEQIKIDAMAPANLLAMPLSQVVMTGPNTPGVANLTIMATRPGQYVLIFRLVDSNGIPIPDELAFINAVLPSGTAILTGEDFLYKTLGGSCAPDNQSVPMVAVMPGADVLREINELKSFSNVIILGNESVVSPDLERSIAKVNVTRIAGETSCETSLLLAGMLWKNGTSIMVMAGPSQVDLFRGYKMARSLGIPLVACDLMTDKSLSLLQEMKSRKVRLSKVYAFGLARDTTDALAKAGLSVEEVS